MRMQAASRPTPGRIGALAVIAMLAAFIAIGYSGAAPVHAAGCTFRLAANGVNGADYTAAEGEGAGGGFKIVVEKLSPGCVGGVNLTLTPGSAVPPGDYSDIGTFGLPFTAVESTRTLNIFPNDDATPSEGSETFTVNLAAQAGDFTTSPTVQTLTIIDNDGPPVFSFSTSNYNVAENAGSVQITVNRSGATGVAVSVQYSTSVGSATAGDFTGISPTTLNFAASDTSKTFNVSITNDPDPESAELFNLILSSPSNGGSVGPNSTVTIEANDGVGTLQYKFTNYTGVEGTTGQFAVTRVGGTTGSVDATCGTTQNGTATANVDYTATPSVSFLTWGPGDAADKFCQVAILPDGDVGSGETFGLTLTSINLGSPSTATVMITDNSGTGTLQFSATSYPGAENGGPITVLVTRTGGTTGLVTVDVATTTSGSTATINTDYTPVPTTTLTFSDGDSSESFTVTPVNDGIIEGTEFVNVVLSNVQGGAALGSPTTAQVNISDDESPLPQITNLSPAAGTLSGGTFVTITGINFSGATNVTFGGFACTTIIVVNSTTITCFTPAHPGGTAEVVVTTPAGSSPTAGTANDYFYTGGPTIISLNPATGQANGNTVVTITGTNFTSSGTTVRFDGILAVHSFVDTTTLVAVSPPHSAGTIRVTVTTPGGTTPDTTADDFTYTGASVPVVTQLSPATGNVGATVVITGSGFNGATLVTFGGVAAVYTVNGDGQITATVPASTPGGTVDVRVTTPSGTSANTTADNVLNTSTGALVTYTLFFRFTLIVWTGPKGVSALAALRGLESPDNPNTNNVLALVGAIWRFDAAVQLFRGYFPGSDGVPGANDFTTLTNGVGYFIALLNPGTVTWTTLGAN